MRTNVIAVLSTAISASLFARDFDIREYGAVGDGKTLDTDAIQKAVDECSAAGGGRVVLGAGIYLSGTVLLKSGVELHLEKDADTPAVNRLPR